MGKRLIASAKEMVAHARGEVRLEEYEVMRPARVAEECNSSKLRRDALIRRCYRLGHL